MEAPRKSFLCSEDTLALVDKVTKCLSSHTYDTSTQNSIKDLSTNLKHHGPSLEFSHREMLDSLQQVLRFSCRDNNLDLVSRVHLLEIIELRALKWVPSDHVTNYYKNKLDQINNQLLGDSPKTTLSVATLHNKAKSSADSGLNVNAPEFTITQSKSVSLGEPDSLQALPGSFPPSLQQPPMGRKKAEDLKAPENGIERNSKPNTYTLKTMDGEVTISSFNVDLFHRAQAILKEKLSHQLLEENNDDKSPRPELTYNRRELMKLATSPLCSVPPVNWENITSQVPDMIKSPAAICHVEKAGDDQTKRPRLQ